MSDSGSSDASPTSPDANAGTATATATETPESTALRSAGRAGSVGAMFLMATSAIGPGFLTQTTTFTDELRAAFAFVHWLLLVGVAAWLLTLYLGYESLAGLRDLFA